MKTVGVSSEKQSAILTGLGLIMNVRIVVTVVLLAWGIGITVAYMRVKKEDREGIEWINGIWLGKTTPIIPFLATMWTLTVLAYSLLPMLLPWTNPAIKEIMGFLGGLKNPLKKGVAPP